MLKRQLLAKDKRKRERLNQNGERKKAKQAIIIVVSWEILMFEANGAQLHTKSKFDY